MNPIVLVVALARAQEGSVTYHLEQARQFVKNKWYADAAAEVEKGLVLPEGDSSFDLYWLGSQVYYELNDVERALVLARGALDLAPDGAAKDQAQAWMEFLATFGHVTLAAPRPGQASRLQLESTSVLFDPELKRLVNRLALELRETQRLPVTVSLPEGDYLVNGAPLHVAPGEKTRLELGLDQLGARGLAALQVPRLEVSLGTQVLIGDRVGNLLPGGSVEVAYTQPVGALLVGALVDWDLRTWNGGYDQALGPRVVDPVSGAVGLRVGRELTVGGPVAVRPSVGARHAWVPGIALHCVGDAGALTCSAPGETPPDALAYVTSPAIAPFLELGAEFRRAGRSTALGLGVKATVEELIGAVPAQGEVVAVESATRIPWTAEGGGWTATGIRLHATVDLAF